MNPFSRPLIALVLTLSVRQGLAQTTQGTGSATAPAQNVPAPTTFHVVNQDGNSQLWEREEYEQTPDGHIATHKHYLTELAAGLNYWTGDQWAASKAEIDVQPDGSAAALAGQQQFRFPADIARGNIQLTTPDGLTLQSGPSALAYDDGESTMIIATLTNSVGQIVGPDQVLYTNALQGPGVSASLLYTYHLYGVEQDIVLSSQLPDPHVLGLGSNAKLQVITEFLSPPTPVETTRTDAAVNNEPDTTLQFGSTTFGQGKAFLIGSQNPGDQVKIYKSWVHTGERTFLVESVFYQKIASQLQTLPQSGSVAEPNAGKLYARFPSGQYALPARATVALNGKGGLDAAGRPRPLTLTLSPGGGEGTGAPANPSHISPMTGATGHGPANSLSRGLVLDYVTFNAAQTNFVFKGDQTYLIEGTYALKGTTTLEGGAVLKVVGSSYVHIDVAGTINCQTGPYHPCIFTSTNDSTLGEAIGSGTPALGDYTTALVTDSTNTSIHDLRFCFGQNGIMSPNMGPSSVAVWNCQFWNVDTAVTGFNVALYNVLCARAISNAPAVIVHGPSFLAENVTADGGQGFLQSDAGSWTVAMTNCLITGQPLIDSATSLPTLQTNCSPVIQPPFAPVYQTFGAGNYYLTNGSPYRAAGTNTIDPQLLANLAYKTTYGPILYSNSTISVDTNFLPRPIRDNNGTNLDIGYHYDPLDFVFGHVTITTTNVVFAPGTAVGWFDASGWGMSIDPGRHIKFNGTSLRPCTFAHYATVQERNRADWAGASFLWFGIAGTGSETDPNNATIVSPTFTHFYSLAATHLFFRDYGSVFRIWANNCEFYAAGQGGYGIGQCMTNCLFDRMDNVGAEAACCAQLAWQNCTMHGGYVLAQHWGAWPVTITNCAFDGTDFSLMDSSNLGWDNNAYTNSAATPTTSAKDVTVPGFTWQTGALGNYYLPANSGLIQKGNVYAGIAGLYFFTTQTNEMPETNAIVDIGYHYPAEDSTGTLYNIYGFVTNGLVAYWKLNDGFGTNAMDWMGTNNLILKTTGTNLPVWGPGYLTFNGTNNYADASNSPTLAISGPITICAWVNSASFPASGYQVPLEKGYDNEYENYFIRYSSSQLEDGSYNNDNRTQFGNQVANPHFTNQWYFLAAAWDGTHWYLYINGLLYGDPLGGTAAGSGALANNVSLFVGAADIQSVLGTDSPARFFNGSIHDVGVYKRALSANEVAVNFLNTKLNATPNPDLLYYHMTDAEAQQVDQTNIVVADYSNSGRHTGYGQSGGGQFWIWEANNTGTTNALHFNGNLTVLNVTNSSSDFNFTTNPFTVNMWILALDAGECFVHNGGITNGWYIAEDSTRHVYFASVSPVSTNKIITLQTSVNASAWVMVTCVWDGSNAYIYSNGEKFLISGTFTAPAPSGFNLIFGTDPTGVVFDGDIWLPQIWGYALSEADIGNLYLQQLNGNPYP